jgi:hypothetical protein
MNAADRLRAGQWSRAEKSAEAEFRNWCLSHCCACRREVVGEMLAVSEVGSVCELCARAAVNAFDEANAAVERLLTK